MPVASPKNAAIDDAVRRAGADRGIAIRTLNDVILRSHFYRGCCPCAFFVLISDAKNNEK